MKIVKSYTKTALAVLAFCSLLFLHTSASDKIVTCSSGTVTIDTSCAKWSDCGFLAVKVENNSTPIYYNTFSEDEVKDGKIQFKLADTVGVYTITLGGAITADKIPIVSSVSIEIGDYVLLGKYNDTALKWRCVAVDQNGPLLLSDTIVAFHAFDAKAPQIGSYGSNEWIASTIKKWLTSSEKTVSWNDKIPDADSVCNNPYSLKPGFLSEFTASELKVIKPVLQTQIVNEQELSKSAKGSKIFKFSRFVNKLSTDDIYSYKSVDRVFLPDVMQIASMCDNSDILGENYILASAQPNAVTDCDADSKNIFESNGYETNYPYWLRTPIGYKDYPEFLCVVDEEGMFDIEVANNGAVGLRPALYLDTDCADVIDGGGTVDAPYIIGYNEQAEDDISITLDLYGKKCYCNVKTGADVLPPKTLFIASYSNTGKLLGIECRKVYTGFNEYESDIPATDSLEKIKAFLVEDINSIKPIYDAVIINR